jgi:replication-associated recombination protein RarA
MNSLAEQYRPRTMDEMVGQATAIRQVKRVLSRGWGGRAFWLRGMSGSGKTTMARIVASHGAEPWSIVEIDAHDLSLEYLREVEEGFRFTSLGTKSGKAWVINEAHGLRGPVLSRLLTLCDKLPSHVVLVFTTTDAGHKRLQGKSDDMAPLLSRCIQIEMQHDDTTHKAYAIRAKQIATKEGLDGAPMAAYEDAIRACAGNMRSLLQLVESGKVG